MFEGDLITAEQALGGVAVAIAVAILAAALWSVARGRRDVRRRAAKGTDAAAAGRSLIPAASLQRIAASFGPALVGDARAQRAIRVKMVQAGYLSPHAPTLYFAARLAAAVVAAPLTLLAIWLSDSGVNAPLWVCVAMVAGYMGPSFHLGRVISRRIDAHRIGFPDFMDLMVVCAEAGLPMEAAIERIAREFVQSYPSLAENLYMASLEIRAGTPTGDALERMGQRLGIEEAATFATLLQQSAELGASLSQSLRVYSDEMRHKRMSRAEEKAYALPAKLVVPLTVFVFPVLIVTLLYPAAVRVMTSMSAS
ncbi:type II secretion system F family protein [Alsobacter sp. KACC 23698]|uniref:Type II secretion system F family protein n=1 Tax=Alsobacter sp. KACC 23698 TaxID=3149229 RepID=A0AAU7JHQ4_9HYPH